MPTVTTTTTTTTTADGTTTTTTTTVTAEEGVPPVGDEDAPAPSAPAVADPLPHPSGMYLRWDPASETAAQGEQAWAELLQRYGELPPVDATGTAAQQEAMVVFDAAPHPWESSAKVVPSSGEALTAEKLANMLRGGGHLPDGVSVKSLEKVALALQGVLSQTFRLVVEYGGDAGTLPTEFIAKFLNPDPAFAFFRMVCGSAGMGAFALEDWCYSTDFFTQQGVRQPKCFFTSYDPQRENFCIIMENLTTSGYTVGDQLSGGPAADQPPNLPIFLDTIEAIASFNSRFVNKCHGEWEGHSLEQWVMGMENEFLHMMWPGMSKAVAATAPQILEDGGILNKDDPFWKSIDNFCELQVDFYNSFTVQEKGGLYFATITHGDVRSENIFFPSADGGPSGGAPAFIDFQLLRRFAPEYDCVYFSAFSVPVEWRREHELEMMNIYYDTLIAKSGQDPSAYTWDVFCMQMQHCLTFLIVAFVFLTPEVDASNKPGADTRKKAMVLSVCERVKTTLEDWDCHLFGPGSPLEASLKRAKANPPLSEWAKEAKDVVPAKFLNGRDASHYKRYKAARGL